MQPESFNATHRARSRWTAPLAAGLVVAGLLVLGGMVVTWLGGAAAWGYDFAAYHDAALRLAATGSPYLAETLSGRFSPTEYGLYLYSPLPAVLLLPLAALTPDAALLAFLLVRVGALVLAIWLMPVSVIIRVATLGTALLSWPVLHDLGLGNVSILITLALVIGWRWLDQVACRWALAIATLVRPPVGLTFLWMIGRRAWRPLAWAIGGAMLLIAATIPFVGLRGWLDFVALLRNVSGVMGVQQNADLGSAVLRLGGPQWAAELALIAGAGVAVAALLLSLRRDRETSYMVTIVAMLLLSPVLWSHYLVQLLIPAAFLAARGWTWALALPLLGWLPYPALPFVTLIVLLLTLAAPAERGPAVHATRVLSVARKRTEPTTA